MASISAAGAGSGLDINSIVSQLMAVERLPLQALDKKTADYQARLSALGKVKSSIANFQTAMGRLGSTDSFKVYAGTSSDDKVIKASASSSAAPGSYALQVVRIAENHKLASGNTFADTSTTTVGTAGDSMTIAVGATSFNVDIGGKTLAQVRDAINTAGDNAGATATLIQDNSGYRLLVTANATGSGQAVGVSYSGADPFALATLNQDRDGSGGFSAADLDASLVLEGAYTVTRSSNTVTDVIDGVTLNLTGAGSATIAVTRDTATVGAAVDSFVKAYNDLRSTLRTQANGTLAADSTLLSIETQLRNVLNTKPAGITGSYGYLSEIGVSLDKTGTMSVDSTRLNTALQNDYSGVANLFAATDQGYASRLKTVADNLLRSDGLIASRSDGFSSRITEIARRYDALSARLDAVESRYRAQFTAMDSLVAQLRSTGDFLTRQLSSSSG